MPDITPLRGVLYDPSKVDFAKVLAPPYDVIDASERARLAAADPHNCVRLILPEADKDAKDDKYAAANRTFQSWLTSGILRRDARRAFYRYQQIFTHPDLGAREVTRTGFIAAVRLYDFAEAVILPHERTLSGPKEDRLALMKATSAHFSQIFTLYRDAAGEVDRLFKKTEREQPIVNVVMPDGVRHVLWRCENAETNGKLRHLMAPKKLYIADGHHRYETMLALRAHFAARGPLSTYSAAQYGTMFLCNVDQQGMVVLPTHRVLHSVDGLTAAKVLEKAKELFTVDRLDNAGGDAKAIRAALDAVTGHQPAVVALFPGDPHAYRLTLAPHANAIALAAAPRAVAMLDVSALHNLLFERQLGISAAAQEAQTNLRYLKDTAAALAEVKKPGVQAVFVLAPTRIETVTAVADAREVMPQKSTFFYPKIASGLVINQIDPEDEMV